MHIALGVLLGGAVGLGLLLIPVLALQLALRFFIPRPRPRLVSTGGGRKPLVPAPEGSPTPLQPYRAAS
jgi:hypothetical protein